MSWSLWDWLSFFESMTIIITGGLLSFSIVIVIINGFRQGYAEVKARRDRAVEAYEKEKG